MIIFPWKTSTIYWLLAELWFRTIIRGTFLHSWRVVKSRNCPGAGAPSELGTKSLGGPEVPTLTLLFLFLSGKVTLSYRQSMSLKGVFYTRLGSKGCLIHGLLVVRCPTAMPCWWGLTRPKQLSIAATAQVIWLCACVRYWPGRGLVSECVTCFHWLPFHIPTVESWIAFRLFYSRYFERPY